MDTGPKTFIENALEKPKAQVQSPLLKLPGEIRNRLYEICLQRPGRVDESDKRVFVQLDDYRNVKDDGEDEASVKYILPINRSLTQGLAVRKQCAEAFLKTFFTQNKIKVSTTIYILDSNIGVDDWDRESCDLTPILRECLLSPGLSLDFICMKSRRLEFDERVYKATTSLFDRDGPSKQNHQNRALESRHRLPNENSLQDERD
ncbi:hypothetical protein B0J11DRAFT_613979 [Dendryphion nanum]|uniref:Uncharacterized protein n=1 Tax=Dendryphion nanum TaxID=256645 RepID=A0A9P9ILC4_9PLEO|nr:hypothetical protein B0J11DRAFT_613979 [Dendryphion nanum]